MTVGTWLSARLAGVEVGADAAGNRYFTARWASRRRARPRRWVIYADHADPPIVPPEWYAWLHGAASGPLPGDHRQPRHMSHTGITGTLAINRPDDRGTAGQRSRSHDKSRLVPAPATTAPAEPIGSARGTVFYTLVRHSAYAQGGNDAFEDAVQLRELTQRDVYTVRAAGGLVLFGWEAALAAENAANYPCGTRHAGAHVRGYFSSARLGDAEIYIP